MKAKWILLADDDPEDREMLEKAIYAVAPTAMVKTFPDGKMVMEFLAGRDSSDLPCTIVLDFNMPFLNGSQVLEEISKYPVYADVPKLIWSTSSQDYFIQTSLKMGAKDYMIKPASQEGFTFLAKKIIGHCMGVAGK